jgi:DNA polymerase-3 subunit gamma/tau
LAYTSLYRKYRSQGFDEVLGQVHITRTLRNALNSGRIAHAYLFTGPRGTGKTSTARILAKALNCLAGTGPTPDPCGVCDACVRIRDGSSMDVMEIDAASNRGIDDIRRLREGVKFAPAEERYKVYVIDEVHQLTGESFNALLKTLEEPPDNVVFVLATTEQQKVPPTILSRCQRFDFRRGSLEDLKDRIRTVCDGEGWAIAPEAVTALAIAASGGFRDALGLLEQVAAYSTGTDRIELADVNTVLGAVGSERMAQTVTAIVNRDAAACFKVVDEVMAEGVEARQFFAGLRRTLRDILRAGVGAIEEGATVMAAEPAWLKEQAKALSTTRLMWIIDCINEAERDLRWVPQQRLLVEAVLVKVATGDPAMAALGPIDPSPVPRQDSARRAVSPASYETRRQPEDRPPVRETGRPAPPVFSATGPVPHDLESLKKVWAHYCSVVGPSTRPILAGSVAVRLQGPTLVIESHSQLMTEKASQRREKLEADFAKAAGRHVPLSFVLAKPDSTPKTEPAGVEEPEPLDQLAYRVLDGEPAPPDDIQPSPAAQDDDDTRSDSPWQDPSEE